MHDRDALGVSVHLPHDLSRTRCGEANRSLLLRACLEFERRQRPFAPRDHVIHYRQQPRCVPGIGAAAKVPVHLNPLLLKARHDASVTGTRAQRRRAHAQLQEGDRRPSPLQVAATVKLVGGAGSRARRGSIGLDVDPVAPLRAEPLSIQRK